MNFRDDYIVFPLHRGWDDMETRVMTGPGSGNDRCHHQETISRTMTEIRTADHFPDALLPRQEYPTGERGRRRIDGRGGWVEVRVENTIGAKNSRIPRRGDGVHPLVLIGFFVEPAVGIEPTTC